MLWQMIAFVNYSIVDWFMSLPVADDVWTVIARAQQGIYWINAHLPDIPYMPYQTIAWLTRILVGVWLSMFAASIVITLVNMFKRVR